MKRIHAFEFEDLHWFPASLRDYMTDYLQYAANRFNAYKNVIPILRRGVEAAGNSTIIDIASGGGGGMLSIAKHLQKEVPDLRIVLTDYYPNTASFRKTKAQLPDTIDYLTESINAMNMPGALKGFRTQFLSLHHFRPADAQAILQDAVDNRQPIGIFEGQQRNFKSFLVVLAAPVMLLLFTPFIKPFRIGRLIFTYLIPVMPVTLLWDGIISVLRTYTVAEMQDMAASLNGADTYAWEIGVAKGLEDIPYLLGLPDEKTVKPRNS